MRWISIPVALLALTAVPAGAKTVRVLAVGNKLEIRYADTYQDIRDKMFALFDVQHPRRGELVQAGVDNVASHLKGTDASVPDVALVSLVWGDDRNGTADVSLVRRSLP